jgi:hypothetical protein
MVGLLALWLGTLAASPAQKSDPLCPHIVPCQYEAPAFNIRVVDEQTGQPLADVHAIATWLTYGGPARRNLLMVLEATSDSEGRLSFSAWGPVRSSYEGVLPSRDPMISLYRPGYRSHTIYNATPLELSDTGRVRAFEQNGETFRMTPFQGTPAQTIAELRTARNPFDGTTVFEYDPVGFQKIYLARLLLVRSEAERLPPQGPDQETFLWGLNADIRSFDHGDRR